MTFSRRFSCVGASVALLAAACKVPPGPTMVVPPAPSIAQPQISTPRTRAAESPTLVPADTAPEPRVDVNTHGREVDVREVLTFLGRQAGLQFIYSPDINKRVRLNLQDVPLSEAIQTVLTVAGLTLQPTSVAARRVSPAVVFYQLPANVDSLSADAIVKRFGVGRGIAELIVQSRRERP